MRRVVLSTPSVSINAGGPARSVSGLYKALLDKGAECELWHGVSESSLVHDISTRELRLSEAAKAALFPAEAEGCIVHDNGLWTPWNLLVSQMTLSGGGHLVVSTRGMLSPWALSQKKWKKKVAWFGYQKRLLEKAALLVATSEAEVRWIRECGNQVPIALIPNGIEIPDLSESPRPSNSEKYVLFLSRLYPGKGLEELIGAWDRLRPQLKLRIVGSGEPTYVDGLRAEIRRRNLESFIDFCGHLEGQEKMHCFKNAEFLVLPSHSENFGIVVAESLAAGTPVLTTTATPWLDLESKDCGWCVDVGEAPLIAGLRQALETSSSELTDMGKRGRSWMQESFSWGSIAEMHLEAYRWVQSTDEGFERPSFIK